MSSFRQPALFVPHGAPTFALQPGAAGAALERLAGRLPPPRAIVVVSAHWTTAVPTVGLATQLETIHDFSGFPAELYAIRYPATGCPEAAREVARALADAGLPVAFDAERGLDHGAWVPLRFMFPDADVPVIPLSIQPRDGTAGRAASRAARSRRCGSGDSSSLPRATSRTTSGTTSGPPETGKARPPTFASSPTGSGRASPRGNSRRFSITAAVRRTPPARIRPRSTSLPLYVAVGAAGDDFAAERVHAGIDDYVLAMDAYAFSTRAGAPA